MEFFTQAVDVLKILDSRHSLHSNRTHRIIFIHKGCIVWCNTNSESVQYLGNISLFLLCKIDNLGNLISSTKSVCYLPFPIMPFRCRRRFAKSPHFGKTGSAYCSRNFPLTKSCFREKIDTAAFFRSDRGRAR